MAIILNIDSSGAEASLCVAENAQSICLMSNTSQKDHASWLQPAIKDAMQGIGISLSALDAVAVTAGPGSYTGLRVGMASAKGLCYGLNIPFITLNTLEIMAEAVRGIEIDYICPMIDARRMEVFTAVYDKNLKEVIAPSALILEKDSFLPLLEKGRMVFFGNGSKKWENLVNHPNALFSEPVFNASTMAAMAETKYRSQSFADLAYSEPIYIKDFYMPVSQA